MMRSATTTGKNVGAASARAQLCLGEVIDHDGHDCYARRPLRQRASHMLVNRRTQIILINYKKWLVYGKAEVIPCCSVISLC